MRISEFAKKFDLSISTVRYYINRGLLMPDKKKDQYYFGKECVADMEKLIKYKECFFSLEEIQELSFLEKASRFGDESSISACARILKGKKKELLKEQDKLATCLQIIEEEIDNLPVVRDEHPGEFGIPFSFLPYLYCPHCQRPLKLDSASLSSGYLYQGELWCECGYKASIIDGIIRCPDAVEESPLKAFKNVDSVITMVDEMSSSYRMLVEKAYLWIYNQIAGRVEFSQTILAGPFSFNFMLKYIDKLDTKNTYLFIDPSMKRIRKMQQYLKTGNQCNLIFIAGTVKEMPLRKNCIDIYIDDYSTVNSLFVYNSFGVEFLAPLLRSTGKIFGVFTLYNRAPKMLQSFKKMHPDFFSEKMTLSGLKFHWSSHGVNLFTEKTFGETNTDDEPHPHDVAGEILEVCGYTAKVNRSITEL